jgi:hypothetical protein
MLNGEVGFVEMRRARPADISRIFSPVNSWTSADNAASVKTSLVIRGAKDEPGVPFEVLEERLRKTPRRAGFTQPLQNPDRASRGAMHQHSEILDP